MLRKISVLASVCVATLAVSTVFAGKPERDRQKEMEPQVKEALAEGKKDCGCEFSVAVSWDSYKKADDMMRIVEGVQSFTGAMKKVCQTPEDKAAFCKGIKGMTGEVVFNKDGVFEKKAQVLICGTNANGYCGDHQVKPVFESF